MTSGMPLTEREIDEILRLAGCETEGGADLLSYKRIAEQLGISERTVRRCIRKAAVAHGKRTKWTADDML